MHKPRLPSFYFYYFLLVVVPFAFVRGDLRSAIIVILPFGFRFVLPPLGLSTFIPRFRFLLGTLRILLLATITRLLTPMYAKTKKCSFPLIQRRRRAVLHHAPRTSLAR